MVTLPFTSCQGSRFPQTFSRDSPKGRAKPTYYPLRGPAWNPARGLFQCYNHALNYLATELFNFFPKDVQVKLMPQEDCTMFISLVALSSPWHTISCHHLYPFPDWGADMPTPSLVQKALLAPPMPGPPVPPLSSLHFILHSSNMLSESSKIRAYAWLTKKN